MLDRRAKRRKGIHLEKREEEDEEDDEEEERIRREEEEKEEDKEEEVKIGWNDRVAVANGAKLKKALISVAAFALVVMISFLFSEGVETPLKDGEIFSASGSRWVGTGLRTFYILAVVAIGAMVFSGVKRFFK